MGNGLDSISEKIIKCAFGVSNAIVLKLTRAGLYVEKEKAIAVTYKSQIVSEYFADALVDNQTIIEIKAVQALNEIHQAQLLNYLNAAKLPLGLLLNFGTPKLQIRRMVL